MELWSKENGWNEENFKKMMEEATSKPPSYARLCGITQDGDNVDLQIEQFDAINGNFEFSGKGVLVFPNGNRYEGGFLDGKYQGDGKLILGGDGFVTHEGQWENGHLSYGIFRNPDGSGEIYEGEWKVVGFNNTQAGKGKHTTFYTVEDGGKRKLVRECDSFVDGVPDGLTRETIGSVDGDASILVESTFVNGKRNGIAKYYIKDTLFKQEVYKDGEEIIFDRDRWNAIFDQFHLTTTAPASEEEWYSFFQNAAISKNPIKYDNIRYSLVLGMLETGSEIVPDDVRLLCEGLEALLDLSTQDYNKLKETQKWYAESFQRTIEKDPGINVIRMKDGHEPFWFAANKVLRYLLRSN